MIKVFFQGLNSLTMLLHAQTCTLLLEKTVFSIFDIFNIFNTFNIFSIFSIFNIFNCVDFGTAKTVSCPAGISWVSLHKRCP